MRGSRAPKSTLHGAVMSVLSMPLPALTGSLRLSLHNIAVTLDHTVLCAAQSVSTSKATYLTIAYIRQFPRH